MRRDGVRLLVSDIRLNGDMPGSELAEFARRLFPNIKVIMTSGKDRPERSRLREEAFIPLQARTGQAPAQIRRQGHWGEPSERPRQPGPPPQAPHRFLTAGPEGRWRQE